MMFISESYRECWLSGWISTGGRKQTTGDTDMDRQLAAFICGLFIGLMVVKHVRRKVVEVEVDRVGSATERKREGTEVENQYPRVLDKAVNT
jgi:hypothetical protein